MPAPSSRHVVLFDGVCALCDASVRFLLARDRNGRLSYAPLQGETAADVISRHGEIERDLSTVVYVRNLGLASEKIYERSDAALEILRDLGGIWSAVSRLRVIPRPIRDAVYGWVARHRYRWFGKLDACRLPEAGTSERFLS